MKALRVALITLAVLAVLSVVVAYSGSFNIAADDPHWGVTARLLETIRERSITRHVEEVALPVTLDDQRVIASGAAEYAEMCTGCHLAPGMKDTEIRKGLYPMPPNLAERGRHRPPAHQFWIVKHGLKMTGMPAWGRTHDDDRIWSLVAFLQKLPGLSPAAYQQLVASAEGAHRHDEMEGMEGMEGMKGMEGVSAAADAHSHEGENQNKEMNSKRQQDADHEMKPAEAPHDHDHSSASAAPDASSVKLPPAALNAAETVDSFQKRLAQGDANGAAQLLDPSVLIYESGAAERSRDEYASHHLKSDAEFLKDAEVRQLSRAGGAVGDFAWVATESELKATGVKPVYLIATETMVLQRGPEGWRVMHVHWSSRPKKK